MTAPRTLPNPAFRDDAVASAYRAFPAAERSMLLDIRALVFETADRTDGVGEVLETLKWGEPAYLPVRPRTGTTIRLGVPRTSPGHCAVWFHCQTNLAERYGELYGDRFRIEGRRAILLPTGPVADRDALAHCISMALTYHVA